MIIVNVVVFILAIIGAVLNLFMNFVSIPYIGGINIASLYPEIPNMFEWLDTLFKNSKNLGFGEIVLSVFMVGIALAILFAPIHAVFAGFYTLLRKKKTFFNDYKFNPVKSFTMFAITSCLFSLLLKIFIEAMLEAISKENGAFVATIARQGIDNFVNHFVPLIWAAIYAVCAVCAYADGQNLKAHQEQLDKMNEILAGQKSQPAVSTENSKVAENIAKPETTSTEKTYEPVLGVETEALIKRANIFLEDEDFDEADRYFEQALNQDPENSNAYIGKLLVAKKVHNIDELFNLPINLTDEKLFQRALKFADGEEKNRLEGYVQAINAKAEEFERIEREKAELARAEEAEREQQRKEALYNEAISLKEKAKTSEDLRHVIDLLKELGDYTDAPDMNRAAQKEFDEVQEKTEKPKTKSGIISVVALVLIVGGILYYSGVFSNEGQRSRVSSNSTSSTTTPSAQSVERTSNTENQPVKTKSEEVSEYYSAGEEAYKEKNYQKAFENFTKAAELGNEEAQLYLARMYHEGEGVEKNLERTLYWMNKAYTTNPNYKNKFMLGIALCEGEDYKRAFPLLKEVAEIQEKDEIGSTYTLEVVLGNLSPQMITHAQMLVGAMYADERDYIQAEYWLKKSIEGGNAQAKEYLDKIQSEIRSQTITQPTEPRTQPQETKKLTEKEVQKNAATFFKSIGDIANQISWSTKYTHQDVVTGIFQERGEETAYLRAWADKNYILIREYFDASWSSSEVTRLFVNTNEITFAGGIKVGSSLEELKSFLGDGSSVDNIDYFYNNPEMPYSSVKIHFNNDKISYIFYELGGSNVHMTNSMNTLLSKYTNDDNSSSTNNDIRQEKVHGEIIIRTKSGGNVNVRSEPSTNSEIVGKAKSGMECSITRRATDEKGYTWYFVEEDYSLGVYGWVRGDLCEVMYILTSEEMDSIINQ